MFNRVLKQRIAELEAKIELLERDKLWHEMTIRAKDAIIRNRDLIIAGHKLQVDRWVEQTREITEQVKELRAKCLN